jgi:FkbH-like protein
MSAFLAHARALRREGAASAAWEHVVGALRDGVADPMAFDEAGRFLDGLVRKGAVPTPALRVHILGQCTTSWLATSLTAATAARGLPAVVRDGGYDQVMQDALALAATPGTAPDIVVLLPWTQRLLADPEAPTAERVADVVAFWQGVWGCLRGLGTSILQVGYDTPRDGARGLFLSGQTPGDRATVRAANEALRAALPDGAYFLDLDAVAGDVGRRAFYDDRRWAWTKQPFSERGTVALAEALAAGVQALRVGSKKVVVLDLDNTLWGGVVGELGPLGVGLGESADGEAFRTFQAACKALRSRGVLLAVASKNERADAESPFRENPAMVLKLEDLAAFEANWGPKSDSLQRIASALNLGLDAFVFVDDNPAEREQVRQALPTVEVVDLPEDPSGYVEALARGRWFETLALTREDAARADQYAQERARQALGETAADLPSYLRSLAMVGDVRPIDDADLPRVVQLLGKTNQWNLTTRRHPHDVVDAMRRQPGAVSFTLRLADRFGDHGLVAVVLAVPDEDGTLRIDTWLMSCRVIARTAEAYVFDKLLRAAIDAGYTRLRGDYLPTPKNVQVASLYADLGFAEVASPLGDGARRYEATLASLTPPPHHIADAV